MSHYSYASSATAGTPKAGLYGREFTQALKRLTADIFATVLEWQERARQRRHLLELDDRMLQDIGVTRADVDREIAKPFWVR
jgi:uncharacterized protein YjiS (DUF1127 family)